jgi:hypothetical protein
MESNHKRDQGSSWTVVAEVAVLAAMMVVAEGGGGGGEEYILKFTASSTQFPTTFN